MERIHSAPGGPYTGPCGRTRVDRVRVFRPDAEPAAIEVFRVVNLGEYPELRAPAVDGKLHLLEDGEPVDVPFVFHDPEARRFALVIPEHARGRELSERAQLLKALMREPEDQVPEYVRHFEIVYGSDGLRAFLDESERMEVDVSELEPVDRPPMIASYYPRLAGLLPDANFWSHADEELAPLVDGDRLWLFVTTEDDAFAESSTDLLIQLKTVDQLPVCVLSLVDRHGGAERRAFLDPGRSVDRPVFEVLRRGFHATVLVCDASRRLRRSFLVEAPRSRNVSMILERAERAPSSSEARWRGSVDLCRATPPPTSGGPHPFVIRDSAVDAGQALRRLRQLERWSTPERIDEALLLRSVPRTTFELARRHIVLDALRYGLAMSDPLILQAVRFGLAPSPQSLVEALVRRFAQIVASPSEHGLDRATASQNQDALRRLQRAYGTSTEPPVSCTMDYSG